MAKKTSELFNENIIGEKASVENNGRTWLEALSQ
jgi:hypothetical protein